MLLTGTWTRFWPAQTASRPDPPFGPTMLPSAGSYPQFTRGSFRIPFWSSPSFSPRTCNHRNLRRRSTVRTDDISSRTPLCPYGVAFHRVLQNFSQRCSQNAVVVLFAVSRLGPQELAMPRHRLISRDPQKKRRPTGR